MSRYSVLIGEIRRELQDLAELTQRTDALLQKFLQTNDQDYVGTLALNLHSFYSGAERIFQDIALTVDESLPNQRDWHRRLLRQMATELTEIRPAVLSPTMLIVMNEFCGFRHVVRNVYSFTLQPERVQDLAALLLRRFPSFRQELEVFCNFLENMGGMG